METKLFEVRDSCTFIPVLCIKLKQKTEEERYLIRKAGYSLDQVYILYTPLVGIQSKKCTYDQYEWDDRTHKTAHNYIIENWDKLQSGEVIDVQYILEETKVKKTSQSLEN
jgi:hypothetical protein